MRVALIHYWLVGMTGGEKVLESLCRLFPQADIYTHVLDQQAVSARILQHKIRTSFIARLPRSIIWYKKYLPLMPFALEQLDLRGYDLVISSESGPAKGVLTGPSCVHLCYCHSPMRYLWDFYQDYLEGSSLPMRLVFRFFAGRLRLWDYASAARVDHFIANSRHVAARVRKHYRRESAVIHPPVQHSRFLPPNGNFARTDENSPYVFLGRLTAYKRADLAVKAFTASGRRLIVIGAGEEKARLEAIAGRNIRFIPHPSDEEVERCLEQARALIFPGLEDFGIVPLEAMSAGRPVVAFAGGGALESVKDGVTGLFFDRQEPEALNEAVDRLEARYADFSPETISKWAEGFDVAVFERKLAEHINALMGQPVARLEQAPL
jgi:glycosyltransferase involved in cell wall biosynthesis